MLSKFISANNRRQANYCMNLLHLSPGRKSPVRGAPAVELQWAHAHIVGLLNLCPCSPLLHEAPNKQKPFACAHCVQRTSLHWWDAMPTPEWIPSGLPKLCRDLNCLMQPWNMLFPARRSWLKCLPTYLGDQCFLSWELATLCMTWHQVTIKCVAMEEVKTEQAIRTQGQCVSNPWVTKALEKSDPT